MSGTTGSVLESPSPVSEVRSPDDVLREMSGISREDSIVLPDDIEARREALKKLVAGPLHTLLPTPFSSPGQLSFVPAPKVAGSSHCRETLNHPLRHFSTPTPLTLTPPPSPPPPQAPLGHPPRPSPPSNLSARPPPPGRPPTSLPRLRRPTSEWT